MQRPASPRRIALLGAESTGKSHLATALAERLRSQGLSTVVVPEVLRGWCEREGRTPRAHEQAAIALEQARQVLVCDGADVVIADTTPLMTAVYSHLLFADGSLYEFSLHHQRVYDATLVTGLDLPWMADGLMRDGPQVREPVDRLLRDALARAGPGWQVVYGRGERRLENALNAIISVAARDRPALENGRNSPQNTPAAGLCAACGDPDCERRLFSGLLEPDRRRPPDRFNETAG